MRALKSNNDDYVQWFMPSEKTKCFSYIRWSSDKQEKGSSYNRQLAYSEKFAKEHDLELAEIVDSGISAFKGKNAEQGALGRFLDAVKEGVIPKNSWLIVENLDRISRQNPRKATRLFTDIIELGITIVTAMDNRIYDLETIDKHPFELITSIMLFSRAHEESSIKSKRTYGSARSIIEKHKKGVRSEDGYTLAIKSVGTNAWWSDCSDGSVKPHPKYFPIAKEIIQMALNGHGTHTIVKHLNNKYPNALPITEKHDGSWSLNRISQMLKKRSLLGEKKITLDTGEEVLVDYYPPLCDEDTFYKIRSLRQNRNVKPEHSDKVYLFLGRDIIHCGHCGSKMTSHTTNENKAKGKYNKFRYKCASGQNATGECRAWTFNAIWLDDTVIRLAANHVFRPAHKAKDLDLAIKGLEEKRADKIQQNKNLIKLACTGNAPKTLLAKMTELEKDIEQLRASIEAAKNHRATELTQTVEWGEVNERVLDYHEHELRRELREKIRLSVKKVICKQVKAKLVKFYITFINDVTITAYRSPMTLVFDGDAWNDLGDFYKQPIALTKTEQIKSRIKEKINQPIAEFDVGADDPMIRSVLISNYYGYERKLLIKAKLEELKVDNPEIKVLSYEQELEIQNVKIPEPTNEQLEAIYQKLFITPESNVGENDSYEYQGLNNISPEMMALYESGDEPKELEHDLTRVDHLTNWADGFSKDVPKVIESQHTTFKHKYKKHVGHKQVPEIRYIDEVKIGLSGTITHKEITNTKAEN